jgi:hypothetical protein
MAITTGLETGYVTRLLGERRNKTFNKFHDQYLAQQTKQATEGHFRLSDMLDDAYTGIHDAITAGDVRVKAENSWRLVDRIHPDPNRKSEGSGTINVTMNQPHIQTAVSNTMSAVAESLAGLQEALADQDPNAHILVGTDALSVPPSQHEVSGGEAPLDRNRDDPLKDLLFEEVERED